MHAVLKEESFQTYIALYSAAPGDCEVKQLREYVARLREVTELKQWSILKEMARWLDTHTVHAQIVTIITKIIKSPADMETILENEGFNRMKTAHERMIAEADIQAAIDERGYEADNTAFYYSVGR